MIECQVSELTKWPSESRWWRRDISRRSYMNVWVIQFNISYCSLKRFLQNVCHELRSPRTARVTTAADCDRSFIIGVDPSDVFFGLFSNAKLQCHHFAFCSSKRTRKEIQNDQAILIMNVWLWQTSTMTWSFLKEKSKIFQKLTPQIGRPVRT